MSLVISLLPAELKLTHTSLAAGATAPISKHFGVTNESQLILPTSIYLVGYVGGPMIWGPISESYGRKWTMIASFALFTVFSIASAVSPNFAALVVFRLFVGVGGSCAISVVGGICADVYHDPVSRGRSMAIFMVSILCLHQIHISVTDDLHRQQQPLGPSSVLLSQASFL